MVIVASGLAAAPMVLSPEPAQAADASQFNPGYIISDENFYNGAAMTEAQIQSFLASRGSALATYRTSVGSRAIRPSADIPGHIYCNAFQGGSNLLASTIIYRAQVACGVSARVLLVTLQKERSLISKGPGQATSDDYLVAMGYGCPDTAPCSELYYGFGNQIYMASLQFKFYQRAENGFNFRPGVRHVQYNPNAGCGGANVNIANWATAALYNYTPYQPNAAALANLYGAGDNCSSYGNRNFWANYTDWFGSPTAAAAPAGNLELVRSLSPRTVNVVGWAFTSGKTVPISIHVYVDGKFVSGAAADQPRSDIKKAYPFQGTNHGFNYTLGVGAGTHNVCVYAVDDVSTGSAALGCKRVVVAKPAPVFEDDYPADPATAVPIYRFWSGAYNSHFYTKSKAERDKLIATNPAWKYEGAVYGAFYAPTAGAVPVYRFWSSAYSGHFYTTSIAERDQVISAYPDNVWLYEGVAYYVYPKNSAEPNTRVVARFWSDTYRHHFYTADASEAQHVKATSPPHIWRYETDDFRVPVAVPPASPLQ